jgi:hypothetical protein
MNSVLTAQNNNVSEKCKPYRGDGVVDVLAVAVAQAHAAEGQGRALARAPGRGAHHVRLHRLLPAPVARHAQLGVVHAAAHAEPAVAEVPLRVAVQVARVKAKFSNQFLT